MQHAAIVAAVQPAPASHPAGPQYASTESDLDGSARPSLGSPFTLRLALAPRSFPSAGAECTGVTGRMVRSPIRRFLNRSSGVGRWRCYGGPLFLGESAVGPGSGRAFGLPEPGPGWGSGGFGRFARSRYHLRPQTACDPPSRGTSAGSTTSAGCTRCRSGAVVAVPDPCLPPQCDPTENPVAGPALRGIVPALRVDAQLEVRVPLVQYTEHLRVWEAGGEGVVNSSTSGRRSNRLSWRTRSIWCRLQLSRRTNFR